MLLRTLALLVWALPLLAQVELLDNLLGCPILAPRQPMIEVQVYTAARVPAVPSFPDAASWENYASGLRRQVLDQVVYRGEARRWRDLPTRVEFLDTIPAAGYRIRKLRYEAVPGLWLPALLYEPEKLSGKVPAVLNVNGHEQGGVSIPYIQVRCINLAKKGVLALNPEWLGRGQITVADLAHYKMNQLDLAGTSGLSVFYLAMKRALDVLVAHENTDPQRVAVTGLSGGGWQTILLSSLDTRVRLADPVAGYSSFVTRAHFPDLDLGDSEQTPNDMATVADYTHLTALLAPRPSLLAYNAYDNCCFRAEYAVAPLLLAARPVFQLYGAAAQLRHHVNYGAGHNYDQDNREAFYGMLRDHFYGGKFDAGEIPSEAEVRTAEELRVPLPENNQNFHTLALELSRELPREPSLATRARLEQIVRFKRYRLDAVPHQDQAVAGLQARSWKLRMDNDWTVPAMEFSRGEAKATTIVVADAGRIAAAAQAERLLKEGRRVLALDPFYFGESRIERRDFLFALQVAAVGDRPLGIQAGQVAAAARWLEARGAGPVSIVALGPRSSLFSLVAAALEPQAIAGLELHNSFRSLKDIIERNLGANTHPELFCFGLLESFDIPQIEALVAPRPIHHPNL